jgi:hypothetical protein
LPVVADATRELGVVPQPEPARQRVEKSGDALEREIGSAVEPKSADRIPAAGEPLRFRDDAREHRLRVRR